MMLWLAGGELYRGIRAYCFGFAIPESVVQPDLMIALTRSILVKLRQRDICSGILRAVLDSR